MPVCGAIKLDHPKEGYSCILPTCTYASMPLHSHTPPGIYYSTVQYSTGYMPGSTVQDSKSDQHRPSQFTHEMCVPVQMYSTYTVFVW